MLQNNGNHRTGQGDFSISSNVWPGLGKIVEETGELNVELGKLIAMSGHHLYEWEDRNLADDALKECSDVVAAVCFFISRNGLDMTKFVARIDEKLDKYNKWHVLGEG